MWAHFAQLRKPLNKIFVIHVIFLWLKNRHACCRKSAPIFEKCVFRMNLIADIKNHSSWTDNAKFKTKADKFYFVYLLSTVRINSCRGIVATFEIKHVKESTYISAANEGWWTLMWFFRCDVWTNVCRHTEHSNGRSPVCCLKITKMTIFRKSLRKEYWL